MYEWLARLRRLTGHADARTAFRAEQTRLRAAHERPAVDPRVRAEMAALAERTEEAVVLGAAARDPGLALRLALSDIAGRFHGLILGGTGSGKSYLIALLLRALLRAIAQALVDQEASPLGLVLQDPKGDTGDLLRELLAELLDALPAPAARRLADQVVVVNPFNAEALVPMQILRAEPGVDPEVQAYETATLVNRLGGAPLGVHQDTLVFNLHLMAVVDGLTLCDLQRLLADSDTLLERARHSASEAVRAYFAGGPRIPKTSLQGVQARYDRLLRLPAARLMLGARRSVSFHDLLGSKILLLDTGSPPLGCEDLANFWTGLFALRLTRGIFQRTTAEAARPVAIFVDEWQEVLGAGGDLADHFERVLAMARSRGVSLWLASQALTGAGKVSATLPKVVMTNTAIQCFFRPSHEDAQALAGILSVTGRRPRPRSEPWEAPPQTPYLSTDEERKVLLHEFEHLPARTFYFNRRDRPHGATLVRTADLAVNAPPFLDARLASRLRNGALAVPLAELEAEGRRTPAEATFRPLPPAPAPTFVAPTPKPRRGR